MLPSFNCQGPLLSLRFLTFFKGALLQDFSNVVERGNSATPRHHRPRNKEFALFASCTGSGGKRRVCGTRLDETT